MNEQVSNRRIRSRSLPASLTLTIAALIVVVAGMHSLVQAQRVTESRERPRSTIGQPDATTFLSVISPTMAITLTAHPGQIHVGGEISLLEARVTDPFLSPVPDGTEVLFETSLGSLGSSHITKTTVAGVASATLTSGPSAGTAQITATAGSTRTYTTVEFIWYEMFLPWIARN